MPTYVRKFYINTLSPKFNFSKLAIMRPSFLMGDRKETRVSEKIGIYVFNLFSPLLLGSFKKMVPIHSEIVAKAMISVIQNDSQQTFSTFLSGFSP